MTTVRPNALTQTREHSYSTETTWLDRIMGGGVSRRGTEDGKRSRRTSGAAFTKLVLSKVARRTNFEQKELRDLKDKFMELATHSGHKTTIGREQFQQALESVGIIETDKELLDILFAHMDKDENGQVDFHEFVVSCSPMISDNIAETLDFSFSLYDVNQKGKITREDMAKVLRAMNRTASWFGDPCLSTDNIEELIAEIFEGHPEGLDYKGYMEAVVDHPILVQFLAGESPVRHETLGELMQYMQRRQSARLSTYVPQNASDQEQDEEVNQTAEETADATPEATTESNTSVPPPQEDAAAAAADTTTEEDKPPEVIAGPEVPTGKEVAFIPPSEEDVIPEAAEEPEAEQIDNETPAPSEAPTSDDAPAAAELAQASEE